ncbi:rRNA processing/ribosome biogenesis-domain-containing protein [Melanogaster broomeanus]|nr:rRNA processing/ribosome biogenesis-domain-containing protein [Melanogaster broomeanus]
MEAAHPLQALLQFHLASDASAVVHVPYVLEHLSPPYFAPSPHLQKWVARITSLMHSKDPGARWAAISIAYRTSILSRSLLIDNAQSWIGIVLPLLSKLEPISTLKASMRYARLVLGVAVNHPEFQRQVASPAVPKVSSALLTIAEKHSDLNIKTLAIQSLGQLVPIYPSLHKALSQRLFALCNHIFSGSAPQVTDGPLVDATASLYSALHFLGGKVGGANLWRNSLDAVLLSSWTAWLALRTTYPASAAQFHQQAFGHAQPVSGEPSNDNTGGPLTALDKLKCGITAVSALLRTPVQRPVRVPIGRLVALCWSLMACTDDEVGQPHFDPYVRAAEVAAVPHIWIQGCRLLSCLIQTTQHLLATNMSRLIMIIASQLEKNLELPQKLAFLQCAYHLLHSCPIVGAQLGIARLVKATLSSLSVLYLPQSDAEPSSGGSAQSRASKKRRREYQADNVLSTIKVMMCATKGERDIVLAALDVLDEGMQNVELTPSTRSLASRVLLSILLTLPSIPSSSLSPDPSFHASVVGRVRDICLESAQGAQYAMSKSTGLVLRSYASEVVHQDLDKRHSQIDLLLHPRRPPFVRTLPFVEHLSLSPAEESAEEAATRRLLGLTPGHGEIDAASSDQPISAEPVSHQPSAQTQRTPVATPQQLVSLTPVELPPPQNKGNIIVKHPTEPSTMSFVPTSQAPLPPTSTTTATMNPRSPPSPSHKAPVANVTHAAPMVVDEDDNEEMPAIDLDSDSDA